jgi:cellulose synthase/poly-beta-1,6-N-acetylglucosamine synthase-like glycosyltransferase
VSVAAVLVGFAFWGSAAFVLYTWIGYPLLVALLARLRPREARRVDSCDDLPPVTLLIAAWREEPVIAARLDDALALDYPSDRLQILVAAEPSPDRTIEIVRSYAARGVELSSAEERAGKSAAVDRALELARGEIVAFSDANNRWEPQALRRLVAPFADPKIGATVGSKKLAAAPGHVAAGGSLYWRYEDFIRRQESRLGGCLAASGEILAVRRSVAPRLPPDTVNDDFHLVLAIARAGSRVVYVPEARSIELTTPTAEEERARRERITAGRVRYMADFGALLAARRPLLAWQLLSHKLLRLAMPWALLVMLVSSLAAVAGLHGRPGSGPLLLGPPWASIALALQLATYAIAMLAPLLPDGSLVARVCGAVRYVVEANLATARGTVRGVTRGQSALWTKAERR